MKRIVCWFGMCACWLACGAADAQLVLTYLRHAEGGHNVVSQFEKAGIPTNEWPAYVGKADVFTPAGEQQAQAIVSNLLTQRFDLIAVSPLWRTRNTILPYLKAAGRQAEIWPELAETANLKSLPDEGGVAEGEAGWGGRKHRITPEESAYFRFRGDEEFVRERMVSNRAEAVAMAEKVMSLVRARAGSPTASVLLVGHGNASHTLLQTVAGDPTLHRSHLRNTGIWVARESDGGRFTIERYNELP